MSPNQRLSNPRAWRADDRTRLLLDSIRDYAIFMLDPEGYIDSWYPGGERMKGYRADEIIGQHFSRFFPPEDLASGKPETELRIAAAQGRFEEEGWRVRKDGSRFWANVVITAMYDGRGSLVGFAKITRDLTDRRRAEEERLKLAQAQEAIRLRDEFLSIASHELKTPLTALQLQLQGLRARVEKLDPSMTVRVDQASRSSERLGRLIEALLDVSRISTGKFTLMAEPGSLEEVVREAIDAYRAAAAQAKCELRVSTNGPLEGSWDRVRIQQVVTNLLSNAIKYGAGAPVEITLSRDGDDAVLVVEDHGPGIPGVDLSRIFERFERAASTRHYGGLGLGLYVSSEIVKAHDGSIVAENTGHGARFTVRVPIAHRT